MRTRRTHVRRLIVLLWVWGVVGLLGGCGEEKADEATPPPVSEWDVMSWDEGDWE